MSWVEIPDLAVRLGTRDLINFSSLPSSVKWGEINIYPLRSFTRIIFKIHERHSIRPSVRI